ncbi:hypothetical protein [Streptomyces phaeochromogenes]|uniref:hypothetical protein n=1 Tax=Streptomyces phaeochromogenes TaxID=1923 RepID=UPI0012FEACFE|nr:hypothetical protein [Streptomyces phaeochromogenes]
MVAEERPSICLVDDAQWLDRVSAQVLGVVARRLMAESVGLVFAVRASEDDEPASEGLPELNLRGLNDRDARSLLDSVTPGWIDEGIRSRSLAEARGNPLALLELPRGSSVADLAGASLNRARSHRRATSNRASSAGCSRFHRRLGDCC